MQNGNKRKTMPYAKRYWNKWGFMSFASRMKKSFTIPKTYYNK